jgi:hypothetical protein
MGKPAIWVLVAIVAALAVFLWRRQRVPPDGADKEADRLDTLAAWPPTAMRILTSAERTAYKTLVRALPGYMILAQVPLARFLKVPTRYSYAEWLRRLGNQCADLVVCDMASEVIAVVNVQASASEASERARKRHKRVARVLKAAHVPLHVWADNALPTPERARELLLPAPPPGRPLVAPPTPSRPTPLDTLVNDDAYRDRGQAVEPPASTSFDDFDSAPLPLQPPTRP